MFFLKIPVSGRRLSALAVALALAGCASAPPEAARQAVAAALAGRTGTVSIGADDLPTPVAPPPSAATPDARIDALLVQPLSDAAAVRIAVLRHPQMQALFAELQIGQADAALGALLPNPRLALGRLSEGDHREFERSLRWDVLGLLTLPWRLRAAERAQAAAQLQAAQRVIVLAAQARNAWIEAVAAAQIARHTRQAQDAAEAAVELGRRMVRAGNWSAFQLAQTELALGEARQRSLQADQAATLARERLARAMGLAGQGDRLRLPERLPDLPAALPLDEARAEERALAERLDLRSARAQTQQLAQALGATQGTRPIDALDLTLRDNRISDASGRARQRGWEVELPLPLFDTGVARVDRAQAQLALARARERDVAEQARSEVRSAWSLWRGAHAQARHWRDDLVPLRQRLTDETLLRYNGMLASPWDVLSQAAAQSAAVASAIAAERDFWLADTELQTALTGTSPRALERLGALTPSDAAAAAPAAAAH
jgi:outer membrane protein TolC